MHGRAMSWMTMGLLVLGITAITLFGAVYPDLLAALFLGAIVILCIGIGFKYPLPRYRRRAPSPGGYRPSRPPIPDHVRSAVWARDGGRCVQCGSVQNLELDHIIPYSKGGADSVRNL